MVTAVDKTKAEKLAEKNGISFYRIASDKFKTTRVDLFFIDKLQEDRASGNALLPSLMKKGWKDFPTVKELERKLESLYGADVDAGVNKKGEMQILSFHMSHIADKYTLGGEKLFEACSDLLMGMLTRPLIENGGFKKDLFSKERDNQINYIRSRVNDKMRFSLDRCMEEMCQGEPFEVSDDGSEEGILLLTPEITYGFYKEMLSTYPAYAYISGNVDDASVQRFIDGFSVLDRKTIKPLHIPSVKKIVPSIRRVDEPMDVNQGKLCLGFRTGVEPSSPDYFPLVVYNGILGGDLNSKLFQNVREKESLAYYAQSMLERYKGLMIIMSGIEAENLEKAEAIILKQVEDMRTGNIEERELKASLNALETGIKAMQDSQGAIVDFFLSQHISKSGDDFESTHEKFQKVTVEDVVRAGQNVTLDTVYFLHPDGTQGGEEA